MPLTVAPFAAGSLNPTTDAILCALLLIHSHLGFQVLVTDYIPKKRFPTARKASSWGLNAITALVGGGLMLTLRSSLTPEEDGVVPASA